MELLEGEDDLRCSHGLKLLHGVSCDSGVQLGLKFV